MKGVVIVDEKDLEQKKKLFLRAGAGELHVLADFDRTLTKAFVDGEKTPSIIAELRKGNYISEDYAKRAQELVDKYHPIEIDPDIPINEKKKKMHEWWTKHFNLLIKSRLNKKHLEQIIEQGKIQFRQGTSKLLDFLHSKNIPLVIISSAGLGGNSILMFLKKQKRLYDNIYIISNSYIWDGNGNAVGIKKPIIHCMNKDETVIKDYPKVYAKIKNRKNVLLLGDGLGDVEMIKGFDYDNLIKIGFLNDNLEGNLERYRRAFDVLILNDGSMNYVSSLLKEITK